MGRREGEPQRLRGLEMETQTKNISAWTALEMMCHTSKRTFHGCIYTIADERYPQYSGRRIMSTLEHGRRIAFWIAD